MSEAELIFTALAELFTRTIIAESTQAIGLSENKVASKQGGSIAKNAKLELKAKIGKKVITTTNYLSLKKRQKLKRKL